ncbi:MAG: RNA polymerase factor sigma-54 [Deltaproteobacteria bacterium]|nr:RNA polymerase factor sigma-54 [Deltaproteobacteria bacterium]
MALQLKQSLNLSQQLIMTPQLQQAIKLLQLSRLELLETINQEMETNPMLEEQAGEDPDDGAAAPETVDTQEALPEGKVEEAPRREDVDWEAYLGEYNTGWAETPYDGREYPSFENFTAQKPNLTSHLEWQLQMSDLSEEEREIGDHIIGNLDVDGYLKTTVEDIAEATGRSLDEVEGVLDVIQRLDPVGVAARDTRECLLIQLRFHGWRKSLAEAIVRDYVDRLENRDYDPIARSLGVTVEEVASAVSVITSLDPRPGRRLSDEETVYISPDIYVFKVGDEYEIVLNEDGLPKLRINSFYRDVLMSKGTYGESTKEYIQDKLKSAAWLIKSIHQRQRTIYRVTQSIVRFQHEFLDKGIAFLKPLVLRDVAEDIEMHESTISRVTTNKYVHTPQGVYELKYFFNSAISGPGGESVASESVKQRIRDIIKGENRKKPYSDQEVAEILKADSINVARRTVAKYRETMGILPSRRRRQIY